MSEAHDTDTGTPPEPGTRWLIEYDTNTQPSIAQWTDRGQWQPLNGNATLFTLNLNRDLRRALESVTDTSNHITNSGGLPDDWWDQHPTLTRIRDHAWSRMLRPEPLLGNILAVTAACIPHQYVLPPLIGSQGSLNLLCVIVGRSGLGKSASLRESLRFLGINNEPSFDEELWAAGARGIQHGGLRVVPLGSGEGIVTAYGERVTVTTQRDDGTSKREHRFQRVRDSILIADAEGSGLRAQLDRAGASLGQVLLKLFGGEDPVPTYSGRVKPDQAPLRLNDNDYRCAATLGLQPDIAQGFFDLTGIGWPQRLLWFDAEGPIPTQDTPPDPAPWQPPFDPGDTTEIHVTSSILTELRNRAHRYRASSEHELDSHAGYVQLKTAAALSALLNPGQAPRVDDTMWRLAADLHTASNRVRESTSRHVTVSAARKRHTRNQEAAERELAIDEARADAAVHRVAAVITRLVTRHTTEGEHDEQGGGCTRQCMTRATASRDRAHLDAAIDHCLTRNWISTNDGRYLPGDSRPHT